MANLRARFRGVGCRDRQVRAFQEAATSAVAEALDVAVITLAASGSAN